MMVREETLETTLAKAVQSLKSSESILVSYTKKIKEINPLHFFEAGEQLNTNRSFWTSTIDHFSMVGIGDALSIKESNLEMIEEKWNTVIRDAIINNPYQTPGTGITAIGGMSFDPLKERTSLWNNFARSELRIPEMTLIEHNENYYLTITVLVNQNDHPIELANRLKQKEKLLLAYGEVSTNGLHVSYKEEIEPNKWKETVRKATQHMSAGKADKIVLAREMRLKLSEQANISTVLEALIESQPTSYIFAFEQGSDCFVGATPERLVKVEKNQLLSTCLAGTAPRGRNEEDDEMLGYQLLHDDKNLQEHDFVVQMIKASVEDFCQDIQIPDKPVLYKLRNMQHLYTPVRGLFKEGYSIFDVIKKLHPTPALGGKPREEALSFIRENEVLDRGWYGAPLGWVDSNQNGEFAVAIRSGLIQGDEASLFAGCGVVKDSDPEAEYEETRIKFLPMLTVLGG